MIRDWLINAVSSNQAKRGHSPVGFWFHVIRDPHSLLWTPLVNGLDVVGRTKFGHAFKPAFAWANLFWQSNNYSSFESAATARARSTHHFVAVFSFLRRLHLVGRSGLKGCFPLFDSSCFLRRFHSSLSPGQAQARIRASFFALFVGHVSWNCTNAITHAVIHVLSNHTYSSGFRTSGRMCGASIDRIDSPGARSSVLNSLPFFAFLCTFLLFLFFVCFERTNRFATSSRPKCLSR